MLSSFPFILDIPNTPQPVYSEVQCQTQALNQQSSMGEVEGSKVQYP